jgi:branched-chain amino acid transport system permease protein
LVVSSGVIFGTLLALTAVGLSLIFGTLDVPNFAQGEFATLGGFSTVTLMGLGLGIVPSVAVALLITFVVGVATERLVFSPLYDRDRFFVLSFFASFGLVVFFEEVLRILYGGNFYQIEGPQLGEIVVMGVSISMLRVSAAAVAVAMLVALYLFTRRTYVGLAIRGIANDDVGARMVGINEDRIYMLTFGIGALISGMTGILYGMLFSLTPALGVELTAFAFVIVVMGGMGSFFGTIIASLMIGLVDSFTATFIGSQYRLFAVFLLLFVILIVFPQGLRGEVEG